MSDALRGHTALVTGASRGIGLRIVERMAEAGARVWAAARSEDALAELSGRTGAAPLPVDLTDEVAVWDALDRLQEALSGPPTIVVNSAGVFGLRSAHEETVGAFDQALAVNLRAPFLVVRALLPAMLERAAGTIVNVGSVSGRRAFPGNGAYSASKFGLRGWHEVLLEELRGTGVRATLLEPAATDTPLWDPLDPDADPNLPDRSAMLSADDVADAVLYAVTRPERVRIPLLQIEHG